MARLEWQPLIWNQWIAKSATSTPDSRTMWWIEQIGELGRSDVTYAVVVRADQSTRRRHFQTLAEAKGWCEEQERELCPPKT